MRNLPIFGLLLCGTPHLILHAQASDDECLLVSLESQHYARSASPVLFLAQSCPTIGKLLKFRLSLSVTTFPMVLRSQSFSTSTQSYMASERFAELANVRTVFVRLSSPRFACPVCLESQRCVRSASPVLFLPQSCPTIAKLLKFRLSLSVTTFPMVLRSSLSTSTQSYMASEER